MSAFDRIKSIALKPIQRTYGETALYFPLGDLNENPIPAIVLFNNHSQKKGTADHDFEIPDPSVEYKPSDWPQLKADVDQKKKAIIRINGHNYWVHKVDAPKTAARDGDMFVALLNIKPI